MSANIGTTTALPALNRQEIQARVNQLRKLDNVRNWSYVLGESLLVLTVFLTTVGCLYWRLLSGISIIWDLPILCVGVFFMGLAQHRLSIIGHEASHYALFRNQTLSEIVSNWSCMYGLLSSTHLYRLQHMAHHQFVNDPEKDPDLQFMAVTGAKYRHPFGRGRFLREIVIPLLLWIPTQVRYILIRAKIASFSDGFGPYAAKRRQNKALTMIHISYLVLLVGLLVAGVYWGNYWLMSVGPVAMALILSVIESRIPETWYMKSAIRPVIATRWDLYQRLVYFTALFTILAWLTHLTHLPWPAYYLVLWFVPLGTSFPFLMMIREEVQHTNAGQERFKHTRNFHGSRLINFAVFPLHMNYHLEHHLFPMIPHYNLPELSEFLKSHDDSYRRTITTVEGYLLPRKDHDQDHATD